jgi:hypothetical protein
MIGVQKVRRDLWFHTLPDGGTLLLGCSAGEMWGCGTGTSMFHSYYHYAIKDGNRLQSLN